MTTDAKTRYERGLDVCKTLSGSAEAGEGDGDGLVLSPGSRPAAADDDGEEEAPPEPRHVARGALPRVL